MVEKAVSLVTVGFAFFFLAATFQIEGFSLSEIGAATWPLMLMVLMLFMGIILTLDLFSKKNKENEIKEEVTEEVADEDEEFVYPKNLWYITLVFAGFSIALPYIGFLLSSIILMLILTILFGMKKWWHRIFTAVVSSGAFILIFPMILNIPFPRGVGIFRDISILFY